MSDEQPQKKPRKPRKKTPVPQADPSAPPTPEPIAKAPESEPVPKIITDSAYSTSNTDAVPLTDPKDLDSAPVASAPAVTESAPVVTHTGSIAVSERSILESGPTSSPVASDAPEPAGAALGFVAPRTKPPTAPPPAAASEPAKPVEAAEPAKPVETAKPVEPAKPVEAAIPIEAAKPAEPAPKPAEPERPAVSVAELAASAARVHIAPHVATTPITDAEGFMLAPEHDAQSPVPVVPAVPVLPSPAEAALEAARIVSQMVDIDSESGAVIAAAAAAGAAIEAAVAAQKVAAVTAAAALPPPEAGADSLPTDSPHDPLSTVRLSRDRILRALHEEQAGDGAGNAAFERARKEPSLPGLRSESSLRMRARTEPGVPEEEAYEDFDPVAIAAAAIGRLRNRARTDLAELRVHYQRHDGFVLLAAFIMMVVAGRVHYRLVTPPAKEFNERGLVFEHAAGWLVSEQLPPPAPRLLRDQTGGARGKDDAYFHVELTSPVDPSAKIEVVIDKKPAWSNIVTGLDLDRRTRWGELYALDDSSVRSIAGHDWLRTAYSYAHAAEKGDIPRIDHAIEFATIDREQIYVVTMFGDKLELDRIEEVVEPSLKVPTQTGLPLVPQTRAPRTYPDAVSNGFNSTVMVVVADLVDGRLKARGGGSGVIVGNDGSILTNYHVIHDKDGRLHDVFVIGRYGQIDQAPQLQCAGRPSRSKLQRELDLALIKCDMDLDGRTWNPASSVWTTLPELRGSEVKMGQRVWVLGYPDVGGGGIRVSEGEVEGWTGQDGAQGRDFIKTDASITHGNSGGPVVDDQGRLIGVAAAFRTRITASNTVIETAQVGLVRPLSTAGDLLAIASAGWTPREGHTDVELTPSAVEAAAEGVRISTVVLDVANEAPIRDALVLVLRSGVKGSAIDMNRLDDQAIAWGKTNAQGEVRLKQPVPVPGTYTVMVLAPGYEPLIGENELRLDERTPASFDPWGKIELRGR